jgi:hypothetical protein
VVEQPAVNRLVAGSNPARGANFSAKASPFGNEFGNMKQTMLIKEQADIKRCAESYGKNRPITITAIDKVSGRVKDFSGVVISIANVSGSDWEIGIETDE